MAMIKAHTLLNAFQREQPLEYTIIANETDMEEGFRLYEEFSAANELGLPPEVYNVFEKLKDRISEKGVTKREFSSLYYETFHRTVGEKRLKQMLNLLLTVGLLGEEEDPEDRRKKRYIVTCHGVFNFENEENAEKHNLIEDYCIENEKNKNKKINTPQGVTIHQDSLVSQCFDCRKILRNKPEFFERVKGNNYCIPCAEKMKAQEKKDSRHKNSEQLNKQK
jgi:hypothetical protein